MCPTHTRIELNQGDPCIATRFVVRQATVEPATPASGDLELFLASDGQLKGIDSAGARRAFSAQKKENLVVNGDFVVAQRQVPGTLTTYDSQTADVYTADRWSVVNENASLQFQNANQDATPEAGLVARNYGTFKKITSAGKFMVFQALEGAACQHLRGRTVRLSLRMKASTATTMRVGILQLAAAGTLDTLPATMASAFGAASTDPTLGTNLAKISPVAVDNATLASTALTCLVTTAWQRFGGTFLLPADFKNLVVAVWTNGLPAANVTVSLSEVCLTDGAEIQDWVPLPIAQTSQLCKRFFQSTFAPGTAPAQNVGVNTGELQFMAGIAAATAERSHLFRFETEMRASPTVTTYSPAAASAECYDVTAAAVCTATAIVNKTVKGLAVTCTGNAGGAVGDAIGVHLAMTAEL